MNTRTLVLSTVRPVVSVLALATFSSLSSCGTGNSPVSAVTSATSGAVEVYASFTSIPLDVRSELTLVIGSMTFTQLSGALGISSIAAMGQHYSNVNAYLSSLQANPTKLSQENFAKAFQGNITTPGAEGQRLKAEIAMNASIISLLGKVSAADKRTRGAAGLSLAGSSCDALPSNLIGSIDDWFARPNNDANTFVYYYDKNGEPSATTVTQSSKPGLVYHEGTFGSVREQEVRITGKPGEARVTGGSIKPRDKPARADLSTCQVNRIQTFLDRKAQSIDHGLLAHIIEQNMKPSGSSTKVETN